MERPPSPQSASTRLVLPGVSQEKSCSSGQGQGPGPASTGSASVLKIRYLQVKAVVLSFIGMRKFPSQPENCCRHLATEKIELRRIPLLGDFHPVFLSFFWGGDAPVPPPFPSVTRFMRDGFCCGRGWRDGLPGPLMILHFIETNIFRGLEAQFFIT